MPLRSSSLVPDMIVMMRRMKMELSHEAHEVRDVWRSAEKRLMSTDRSGGSMVIGEIRPRKRARHAERERDRDGDRTLSLRSSNLRQNRLTSRRQSQRGFVRTGPAHIRGGDVTHVFVTPASSSSNLSGPRFIDFNDLGAEPRRAWSGSGSGTSGPGQAPGVCCVISLPTMLRGSCCSR